MKAARESITLLRNQNSVLPWAANSNAVYAPDQASAVEAASTASAYVVAVGEKAYAEGWATIRPLRFHLISKR